MGLSVIAQLPDWEQQIRYANNMGAAGYIAPDAWIGENSMNGIGLADANIAGLGDGGQITQAVTQGISQLAQTFAQIQANKGGKGKSAPAKAKSGPAPMSSSSDGGGGGGDGNWISGIPNWGVIAGVGLIAFILIFAMTKKKGGGGEHRHEAENPWAL